MNKTFLKMVLTLALIGSATPQTTQCETDYKNSTLIAVAAGVLTGILTKYCVTEPIWQKTQNGFLVALRTSGAHCSRWHYSA